MWGSMQRAATLDGHTGEVRALEAFARGRFLATGAADRTVRVWETTTGRCLATMRGHHGAVHALAALRTFKRPVPDRVALLIASGAADCNVQSLAFSLLFL